MKSAIPTLHTQRLTLRPFNLEDADTVQQLAGDRKIYETTLNIPHPYKPGMAEEWIAQHQHNYLTGNGVTFAICSGETLVGAVGLMGKLDTRKLELGYWIGVPYWGNGYCTEAAQEVVKFGFEELGCHKICAHYMQENAASGRVMEKIGMIREGVLKEDVLKDGVFKTVVLYRILKSEHGQEQGAGG